MLLGVNCPVFADESLFPQQLRYTECANVCPAGT